MVTACGELRPGAFAKNGKSFKQECLAALPHLKEPWQTLFGTGDTDWQQRTAKLAQDKEWGNEVCLSLIARVARRPVIVVGVGQIFMTSYGPRIPDVTQAIVLKLEKEHYWAMNQALTMSMLRAAHAAHTSGYLGF